MSQGITGNSREHTHTHRKRMREGRWGDGKGGMAALILNVFQKTYGKRGKAANSETRT